MYLYELLYILFHPKPNFFHLHHTFDTCFLKTLASPISHPITAICHNLWSIFCFLICPQCDYNYMITPFSPTIAVIPALMKSMAHWPGFCVH
jgi:hypothetical protein